MRIRIRITGIMPTYCEHDIKGLVSDIVPCQATEGNVSSEYPADFQPIYLSYLSSVLPIKAADKSSLHSEGHSKRPPSSAY